MVTSLKTILTVLTLGLAYALLFYQTEMGLNLFLFDALLIGLTLCLRPELAQHKSFVWSVGGLLFTAGSVVIVHTNEAVFAHHLTYLLVLGFAQARELRFVWFGLLLGLDGLFGAPIRAFKRWRVARRKRKKAAVNPAVWAWAKQAFIPALVVVPFLVLYLGGNDQFARGLDAFLILLNGVSISGNVFWTMLLIGFGTLLTLGFLVPRTSISRLVKWQSSFQDKLVRRPKTRAPASPIALQHFLHPRPRLKNAPRNSLALKGEYRQAVLTFGLLNLLLAVVNATDLRYVWLDTGQLSAADLSAYVHGGTWSLVFSIVLAMLVILYYFRGNLNFLKDSPHLAPLAKLWVAQNALLALSVGVRNWHYVDAYGLAYGRVYIAFVLLLILFGLFTLFRKVRDRLTLTYLLQTNGMAAWLCLLLFAAVNWTNVITRVNLATQSNEEIDWHYLRRELPPDNVFLLLEHPEAEIIKTWKSSSSNHEYADWRSWNYTDWRNLRALR